MVFGFSTESLLYLINIETTVFNSVALNIDFEYVLGVKSAKHYHNDTCIFCSIIFIE